MTAQLEVSVARSVNRRRVLTVGHAYPGLSRGRSPFAATANMSASG